MATKIGLNSFHEQNALFRSPLNPILVINNSLNVGWDFVTFFYHIIGCVKRCCTHHSLQFVSWHTTKRLCILLRFTTERIIVIRHKRNALFCVNCQSFYLCIEDFFFGCPVLRSDLQTTLPSHRCILTFLPKMLVLSRSSFRAIIFVWISIQSVTSVFIFNQMGKSQIYILMIAW